MNEDDILLRLTKAVTAIRSGTYVSRETLVELLADIYDFGESQGDMIVNPEMVREAEAHFPFALKDATPFERWEWYAAYYTKALLSPDEKCSCCGVTLAGDASIPSVQLPLLDNPESKL